MLQDFEQLVSALDGLQGGDTARALFDMSAEVIGLVRRAPAKKERLKDFGGRATRFAWHEAPWSANKLPYPKTVSARRMLQEMHRCPVHFLHPTTIGNGSQP
jgi:hypothetical protein